MWELNIWIRNMQNKILFFLLILKRNKLSGTVSTCLYSVTAAHFCFDLKLQEQKQKYSSLLNTNKMCELSYK